MRFVFFLLFLFSFFSFSLCGESYHPHESFPTSPPCSPGFRQPTCKDPVDKNLFSRLHTYNPNDLCLPRLIGSNIFSRLRSPSFVEVFNAIMNDEWKLKRMKERLKTVIEMGNMLESYTAPLSIDNDWRNMPEKNVVRVSVERDALAIANNLANAFQRPDKRLETCKSARGTILKSESEKASEAELDSADSSNSMEISPRSRFNRKVRVSVDVQI